MKIDITALLTFAGLCLTVLGGWIAYLKHINPKKKDENDERDEKLERLERRQDDMEDKQRDMDSELRIQRKKLNRIIDRLIDKSSF